MVLNACEALAPPLFTTCCWGRARPFVHWLSLFPPELSPWPREVLICGLQWAGWREEGAEEASPCFWANQGPLWRQSHETLRWALNKFFMILAVSLFKKNRGIRIKSKLWKHRKTTVNRAFLSLTSKSSRSGSTALQHFKKIEIKTQKEKQNH